MVEFIVCFGSDDEKKENKRKKGLQNAYKKESERKGTTKKKRKKNSSIENDIESNINNTTLPQSIAIPSIYKVNEGPEMYDEELDYGNLEYKLKLTDITQQKLEKRITQMKFRLREGNGECRYYIGVEDSGNPLGITEEDMRISIETITKMTSNTGATLAKIDYMKGKEGLIAEITITKPQTEKELMEIRIGLFGEEESGKSTLIGCLMSDRKDNGKGLTRTNVFRHRHEINCGKTSSFTHQIIGFDKNGKKTNINSFGTVASWPIIVEKSVKVVNFIDMGGSDQSLQNSLKTFSSNYLDYIFLVISSQNGITSNTSVFLKLALSLNIPIAVIFTKTDQVNQDDFETILMGFNTILKKEKRGKNPLVVKDTADIVTFANNMTEGIMPIFLVSNVTGYGLDYINNFLSILPSVSNIESHFTNMSLYKNKNKEKEREKVKERDNEINDLQFDFLEIITKKEHVDKGHVIVEGIVTNGMLFKGEKYRIGPFNDGTFKYAKTIMVHCKKMEVNYATKGQFCSVELDFDTKQINNNNSTTTASTITSSPSDIVSLLRTGMVLIGPKTKECSAKKFIVELWSMSEQPFTIKYSYQPIVHLSHISQCVKISNEEGNANNENDVLVINPNETFRLVFEFLYYPEFISKDSFLIILDKKNKIYGHVKDIII